MFDLISAKTAKVINILSFLHFVSLCRDKKNNATYSMDSFRSSRSRLLLPIYFRDMEGWLYTTTIDEHRKVLVICYTVERALRSSLEISSHAIDSSNKSHSVKHKHSSSVVMSCHFPQLHHQSPLDLALHTAPVSLCTGSTTDSGSNKYGSE